MHYTLRLSHFNRCSVTNHSNRFLKKIFTEREFYLNKKLSITMIFFRFLFFTHDNHIFNKIMLLAVRYWFYEAGVLVLTRVLVYCRHWQVREQGPWENASSDCSITSTIFKRIWSWKQNQNKQFDPVLCEWVRDCIFLITITYLIYSAKQPISIHETRACVKRGEVITFTNSIQKSISVHTGLNDTNFLAPFTS